MNYLIVTDEMTGTAGKILAEAIYHEMTGEGNEDFSFVFRIQLEENEVFEDCRSAFVTMEPDVIVTFDMAGMNLIDDTNETVYNHMYCKCIHILTREPWFYPETILRRMGILTTVVTATAYGKEYLKRYYENIPCVRQMRNTGVGGTILGFISGGQEVIIAECIEESQLMEELHQLPEVFLSIAEKVMASFMIENIGLFDRIIKILESVGCEYTEGEIVGLTTKLKNTELIFKLRELREYICNLSDKNIAVLGKGWEAYINESNGNESNVTFISATGDGVKEINCSYELISSMINLIR